MLPVSTKHEVSMFRRFAWCGCAALGVLSMGLDARTQSVPAAVSQPVPLFSTPSATAEAAIQIAAYQGERRRRAVQVNLDVLGGFYGAGPVQSRLQLVLFSGEAHTAALDRLE